MGEDGEHLPIITHSKRQHGGHLFPTFSVYTGMSHTWILGWRADSYTLQTQARLFRLHLCKAGQKLHGPCPWSYRVSGRVDSVRLGVYKTHDIDEEFVRVICASSMNGSRFKAQLSVDSMAHAKQGPLAQE